MFLVELAFMVKHAANCLYAVLVVNVCHKDLSQYLWDFSNHLRESRLRQSSFDVNTESLCKNTNTFLEEIVSHSLVRQDPFLINKNLIEQSDNFLKSINWLCLHPHLIPKTSSHILHLL